MEYKMKHGGGQLIGLLGLYFITILYSHAQAGQNVQPAFEPISLNTPVYIQPFELTESFDGLVQLVTHQPNFDLSGYTLKWSIEKIDSWNGKQSLFTNQIALGKYITERNNTVSLGLPANWTDGDLLNLSLMDTSSVVLYSLSEPIRKPKEGNQSYFKQRSVLDNQKIRVRESTLDFQVIVGETLYIFGKENGNLQLVKIGTRFINFSQNIEAGHFSAKVQKLTWKRLKDGAIQIRSAYQGNSNILTWTVFPNSELKMEISSPESIADLEGIEFSFPEEKVEKTQWIGEGRHELSEVGTFGLWIQNPQDLLAQSPIDSRLKVAADIHAFLLDTDEGSIEVRSETPNINLSLDRVEEKDMTMGNGSLLDSASAINFHFTIQNDYPQYYSISESVIPLNKKDAEETPPHMVLLLRFN
ncbi:hypothetical protein [Algoriphagus winogradskyi]|uniref:Uncharacterized protein n=1 Tax=Algoriphagus winogradskyi TaxID=237017 RepID=A0ABY1N8V9_9BACT|nr:hypothetical protein [Algoriphagus winogradskyi]SMP01719.1 hypothetical protein SAMN06265367_10135 [Algoriphagus winogradskyi]